MAIEHWVETSLGNIVISKKGKKPKSTSSEPKENYVPYILIDELEGKAIRLYTNDSNIPRVNERDVLLVWDGSIGKCSSGLSGAIGSTLVGLTPIGNIPTKFLEYIIIQANAFIKETSTGIGLQHINKHFFEIYKINLPPLAEQKRIVKKLDAILPKVKNSKARLDKIPRILKRFRQSILLSAFSGDLTNDWRDENVEIETGEELLNKIVNNRTKRKRTQIIDEQYINLNLPSTWAKTNIDSISNEVIDCLHSTPKWATKGLICLRTTNFLQNKLNLSEKKYVSKSTFLKRISRLKPERGDILYSREGGILGIACILDVDDDVCLGQRMMLFRLNSKVSNRFICYFLNSPLINNHVNMLIGGSAAPHINVGDIKQFPVSLPPLEEQNEIVHRVEELFKLSDSLEAKYKKAMERVGKIEQSILAKAFCGELAKQDPNDEPAEELLKRILAEKAKLESVKKKPKRSKRRSTKQSTPTAAGQ